MCWRWVFTVAVLRCSARPICGALRPSAISVSVSQLAVAQHGPVMRRAQPDLAGDPGLELGGQHRPPAGHRGDRVAELAGIGLLRQVAGRAVRECGIHLTGIGMRGHQHHARAQAVACHRVQDLLARQAGERPVDARPRRAAPRRSPRARPCRCPPDPRAPAPDARVSPALPRLCRGAGRPQPERALAVLAWHEVPHWERFTELYQSADRFALRLLSMRVGRSLEAA